MASAILSFVGQLVDRYPAMRSIWVIGDRADGDAPESPGPFAWDLVVFADLSTLQQLRNATDLRRADVVLRIVTDGDRFEIAWDNPHMSGSLFRWDWCQVSDREAYYSEARWAGPLENGDVERTRREATRVWQSELNRADHLMYFHGTCPMIAGT